MVCDGATIVGAGVFLPDEGFAKRIGQPKNKCPIAVYALSGRCADDYGRSLQRMEKKILREAGVQ
jgi:hypothetical protein